MTGPQAKQAPIIHVPDPDPFKEKLETRIGLVNPDRNHQVKCEECDRFLKSKKIRKLACNVLPSNGGLSVSV